MKPCDEFKKIILSGMQSVLKPHGFRKKQSTFQATRRDTELLVMLQSSMGTTSQLLKATVNLAVFSRTLVDREGRSGDPGVWDAHWRERIGALLPQRDDKWWLVASEQQAEQAGQEICDLLERKAVPLLESLGSTEALVAVWASGASPGLTDHQRLRYLNLLAGE